MSPTVGVLIVITFMLTNLCLGLAILIRTINEGKAHKA